MDKKRDNQNSSVIDLWSLFEQAVFTVTKLREMELMRTGMTVSQSIILQAIQDNGGSMTLQEIEKNGMRQFHTVSTMISRMDKAGLVSKVKNPENKRYQIVLTEKGKDLCNRFTTVSLEMVFEIFSAEEKARLVSCLAPVLKEARYWLAMKQSAPFLMHLNQGPERNEMESDHTNNRISDLRLWILLDQARFVIGRLHEMELAQYGVTVPQASILQAIMSHGNEVGLQELGEKRMRQHYSIFSLINRMIKSGLIEQVTNSRDKGYRIIITEKGREVYCKLTSASLEMAFSAVSPEIQQELSNYLKRLLERARYLMGGPYVPPFLRHFIYGDPGAMG